MRPQPLRGTGMIAANASLIGTGRAIGDLVATVMRRATEIAMAGGATSETAATSVRVADVWRTSGARVIGDLVATVMRSEMAATTALVADA